jgi:catechol 2,3-dioxygenase
MAMTELGHVVFYVRDLDKSVHFYTEVVGLRLEGGIFNHRAAVLTGGHTHHELLLIQVGAQKGPLTGARIGLYHVGWKVGDNLDALRTAYKRVIAAGYTIDGMSDHTMSQSLYLHDPDGNELELFVDNPGFDWRNDKSWMDAPVKPLDLDVE